MLYFVSLNHVMYSPTETDTSLKSSLLMPHRLYGHMLTSFYFSGGSFLLRLKELLRKKLVEGGWRDELKEKCKGGS